MVRLLETCFRIKNDTYYLKCSVYELRPVYIYTHIYAYIYIKKI